MADGEDIAIDFYQPGNAQALAECLFDFLTNPAKQETMAMQNFASALRMTMPTIAQKYLRHFELEQRAVALRHVTRFRRLPGWVPSKAPLLKMMTRNSLGWVHRSAIRRPLTNGQAPDRIPVKNRGSGRTAERDTRVADGNYSNVNVGRSSEAVRSATGASYASDEVSNASPRDGDSEA
jgi:hypothetical protein